MKYYIIAGEKSGDMHASNLMQGILDNEPQAEFRFWGGDDMQKIGGTLVKHYRELAFMGFWEVLKNIWTIRKLLTFCKKDIQNYMPDAIILVDYAGFNLQIAKFIKKNNLPIKIFYYISPKVWAWNQARAKKIREIVDKMFVIFPFEVDFYKKYNYDVEYVGNPIQDALAKFSPNPHFFSQNNLQPQKPILAFLAGSRVQEIKKILPLYNETIKNFPHHQCIIAGVSHLSPDLYQSAKNAGFGLIFDQTYDLLHHAQGAIVVSGTATLETALLNVPQVIVYRTSAITAWIVRRIIQIRFIGLVNLVVDKSVVVELIQQDANPQRLTEEIINILPNGTKYTEILQNYQELQQKIGKAGASKLTGKRIVELMRDKFLQ